MRDHNRDIVGAITGTLFVGVVAVGASIIGSANLEPYDSSGTIARTLVDRSDQTELGSLIVLVGLVFFSPFLAYLRYRFQQAEGVDGWLSTMTFGRGIAAAAMFLLFLGIHLATVAVTCPLKRYHRFYRSRSYNIRRNVPASISDVLKPNGVERVTVKKARLKL